MLGGIQRFSTEDGPGIRTTLFFKGCPLNCKWCHNPELISTRLEILYSVNKCIRCGSCIKSCPQHAIRFTGEQIEIDRSRCVHCGTCAENCYTDALRTAGEYRSDEELMDLLSRDRNFYEETGGGVTLSGGEVTSQTSYAFEILQGCRAQGLDVAIDTCGYTPYENLEKLCADAQVILYDIKCIDSDRHKALTGVGNERIIDNLRRLAADPLLHEKIIIRMPLVHPLNDSLEEMQQCCDLYNELGLKKVNGIPYHTLGTSKTRSMGQIPEEYETPSDEHLDAIQALFQKNGIPFTIMGKDD